MSDKEQVSEGLSGEKKKEQEVNGDSSSEFQIVEPVPRRPVRIDHSMDTPAEISHNTIEGREYPKFMFVPTKDSTPNSPIPIPSTARTYPMNHGFVPSQYHYHPSQYHKMHEYSPNSALHARYGPLRPLEQRHTQRDYFSQSLSPHRFVPTSSPYQYHNRPMYIHSSSSPSSSLPTMSPLPAYQHLPVRYPGGDPRMQAFQNLRRHHTQYVESALNSPIPSTMHSSPSPIPQAYVREECDSPPSDSQDMKKRRRSAKRETLQYCGLFKDSDQTHDYKIHLSHSPECVGRIRLWKDVESKLFFDCECGRRKPTQDLRKILKHSAGHDVSQYECSDCGRVFQHHLGLNSHQRIHKKAESPYNCI